MRACRDKVTPLKICWWGNSGHLTVCHVADVLVTKKLNYEGTVTPEVTPVAVNYLCVSCRRFTCSVAKLINALTALAGLGVFVQ